MKLVDEPDGIFSQVCELLEARFGPVVRSSHMSGMSGSVLWRIEFPSAVVAVKASCSPAEREFYELSAEGLRRHGVGVPELYASGVIRSTSWLAREFFPDLLPSVRWYADADVLRALRALHAAPVSEIRASANTFARPSLEELANRYQANQNNQRQVSDRIGSILHNLSADASSIRVTCGDANPTNWGLRANSEIVLFDWERFALGWFPVDLATTVPGLGSYDDIKRTAQVYLQKSDGHDVSLLTRRIAAAKLWTALEFLHSCSVGDVQGGENAQYVATHLTDWLETTARWVSASD